MLQSAVMVTLLRSLCCDIGWHVTLCPLLEVTCCWHRFVAETFLLTHSLTHSLAKQVLVVVL